MAEPFQWPVFYAYPPYFTLQPIKETRAKQSALWRDLILAYCKHHNIFVLTTTDDGPIFSNKEINRRLPAEARVAFLADAVAAGQAAWLDPEEDSSNSSRATDPKSQQKSHSSSSSSSSNRRALIFWRPLSEWGELLLSWARESGFGGGGGGGSAGGSAAAAAVASAVLTLDELDSGTGDATGCPLSRTHRELVRATVRWLAEVKGAVALFGGSGDNGGSGDGGEDVGVKFL